MIDYQIETEVAPFWARCFKCGGKLNQSEDGYAIVFEAEEMEKDELDRKGHYCCLNCLDKLT